MTVISGVLKINTNLSQTKDCTTIQFLETTGAYSSTNLGGYGSSNFPISSIDHSILQISQFNNDYVNIAFNNTTAQSIANGTVYNITNIVLNQGQSDFISDVYLTNYIVFFQNLATSDIDFVFTSGSNLVPYVNGGSLSAQLTGMSYFQIAGDPTIYQVASISGNNASGTITLTLPATTSQGVLGTNFFNGYSKENTIDITCPLKNCVASNIATIDKDDNCNCADNQAFAALGMLFAIQSNMAVSNYTKVQEIIKWLTVYCDEGDCGCH